MSEENNIYLGQLIVRHPVLAEQFKDEVPALEKRLLQEVDESSFSLSDWLDSLDILYYWLNQRALVLSLHEGLGYVSCAAKSVGNSSSLVHLPSLVYDFLEQYGCELAVKK